jgi:hypothetical protein
MERELTQPENAEYFRVAAKNSDFDRWAEKNNPKSTARDEI